MKKNLLKRAVSILVILVMLIAIVPTTFAAWEDGQNCEGCGHYHWDEYMCGMCGYCSTECTNTDCCVASHCNECGTCLLNTVWCSECMTCEECYIYNGWHCLGCNECYFTDEQSLCGECWFCESCVGAFCDDCGFCLGCQELDGGVHCPECQNCYATTKPCLSDGEHCQDCCLVCPDCDECVFDEGLELCDECGRCELCCEINTQSEGCDCGEYCVEQSDWYEHICPDCGTPFCVSEMCDTCQLCLDCCESNSDCSDGLCVMDPEYDVHFCEDCGECIHNVDLCSSCEDVGELRCEDCCRLVTEQEGCDWGDVCFNMDGFDSHIASEHIAGGSHSATPQSIWMFNENYHWRNCKYCDEPAHSYLNVASHNYNNYGICKVCNYDSKSKIVILKQPISRVCDVSDNYADISDMLHESNNKVSFNTIAKGLTNLKYQWYQSYGGNWTKLTDSSANIGNTYYYTVHGAQSPNLKISVPVDICYSTSYYKCVITDENGNTVETAPASIRSSHIYKKYTPRVSNVLIGIIRQPNNNNNIGVYESTGHFVDCIGDGCEEYKIEAHTFAKTTEIIVDSVDGTEWVKRTCTKCGGVSYIKNHEHYFIDPQTKLCEVDYTYENSISHKLKCLHPGCDKTTLETHTYLPWQNMGTPYTAQNGIGTPYRECYLCSYQNTKKPQRYDKSQGKNVSTDWTKTNDLVNVLYGTASSDIVCKDDEILISFAPTVADKTDTIKMTNPRCLSWRVHYYCKTATETVDKYITSYFTVRRVEGTNSWKVKINYFPGYTGGGIFTFEPVIDTAECSHIYGTRIQGAYDPICIQEGYTGDTVCVDCGHVIKYGEVIEGGTEHEGELVLNPLTVRQGSCENRGYSGTSRCTVCNMSVRGKSTPKVHTGATTTIGYEAPTCYEFGKTGDTYCDCGALIKESRLIAPEHKNTTLVGYVAPTASVDGYSGDTVCEDCDLVLKYGYTLSSDRVVSSIIISDLDAPFTGDSPDFDVTLSGIGYSVDKFSVPGIVKGISWTDTTSGNYVYPSEHFRRDRYYKVQIRIKANEGYHFAGDMTAKINGSNATIRVNSEDPSYATILFTYYCYRKSVTEINVTQLKDPDEDYYYYSEVFEFDRDFYEIDDFFWYLENNKYYVELRLVTTYDRGLENCVFDSVTNVNVNGKPAQILEVTDEYVSFCYTYDKKATLKGTVNSTYDSSAPITLQLFTPGAPEPAYEEIVYGNVADYSFDSIAVGNYTFKVTKPMHKTYTAQLNIQPGTVTKNIVLVYTSDPCSDGHSFTNYLFNYDATCDKDGTETAKCDNCQATDTRTKAYSKLNNTTKMFTDIKTGAWYKYYVDYAVTFGIFSGTGTGFAPNMTMTRAQLVMIFANLSGINTDNNNVNSGFTDVPKNQWYTAAIKWAAENGIVAGDGTGKFNPNGKITREQMCVMMVNFVKNYQHKNLQSVLAKANFKDDAKISSWAKEDVYLCQMAGLVSGDDKGNFNPLKTASRAEGATLFTDFHKNYVAK